MRKLCVLKALMASVLSLLWSGHALGETLYVDATPEDGTWTDCYTDLSQALADAGPGDHIWVAEGVYVPTINPRPSGSERFKTFVLKSRVSIYGGFAGNETNLDQRDPVAFSTILSGDIGIPGVDSDNCYNVIRGVDNARLDGFTVTGGKADYLGSYMHGAGMYNEHASPVVANCIFQGNHSSGIGGALDNNWESSPTIVNCVFADNSGLDHIGGGGMANNIRSSPLVKNCLFINNYGGAVGNNQWSDPTFENCTFAYNPASVAGGIYNNHHDEPTLSNCIFWGNSGPQIHHDGDNMAISCCDIQGGLSGIGGTGLIQDLGGNISQDPLFVSGPSGEYYLSQIDAGQVFDSPCLNAGNTLADTAELSYFTTRVDGMGDSGVVDMGYHYLPEPALFFQQPDGGEKLLSGTNCEIEWITIGTIRDIFVEYSTDHGATWSEVSPPNAGNGNKYDWVVPDIESEECLIRISDAADPCVYDGSEAPFEITMLDLLYPTGGEKLLINTQYAIKWQSANSMLGNGIRIEVSSDGGLNWSDLATVPNTGYYLWQVPELESDQYLIRISDFTNPSVSEITGPFVVYSCRFDVMGDNNGDCRVDIQDFALMVHNWLYRAYIQLHDFNMDEDPGWNTEGQWAYGIPMGNGGTAYGNPDPSEGFTGSYVYGVNLEGDYAAEVGGPYYLTTDSLNCGYYENMKLIFSRWLNSDIATYVRNTVEISNDGQSWIALWDNSEDGEIADNDWQEVELDISAKADNQENVYIRWGYEIFDRAYPYSGWNIDDVQLWGNP